MNYKEKDVEGRIGKGSVIRKLQLFFRNKKEETCACPFNFWKQNNSRAHGHQMTRKHIAMFHLSAASDWQN